MKNLKHNKVNILLIIIILIQLLFNIGLGFGLLTYSQELNSLKKEQQTEKFSTKKYDFKIQVPDSIEVIESTESTTLKHSILYEHDNPCFFSECETPILNELTDFLVSIKIYNRNLQETALINENDYVISNFLCAKDGFEQERGFIEEVSIGSLNGFRISESIEGCGEYRYYFPIDSNNTLFITRRLISELTGIFPGKEEYLALPEIIPPENEESLFNQIISSLELEELEE